ncbi:MAG: arsenate reductase family protein [Clostridiales bacterium]|jgi:arsenate reductase|nr:arsenate reductase family protein [Clostridiales bacterium]
MDTVFICHPRCSTCKKAQEFLDKAGIGYVKRDITVDNPAKDELYAWISQSGLEVRKFFNTSGMLYRDLGLKDKLDSMSLEEKIELLASDGMLVKRPILLYKNKVLVGFNEKQWSEALNDNTPL